MQQLKVVRALSKFMLCFSPCVTTFLASDLGTHTIIPIYPTHMRRPLLRRSHATVPCVSPEAPCRWGSAGEVARRPCPHTRAGAGIRAAHTLRGAWHNLCSVCGCLAWAGRGSCRHTPTHTNTCTLYTDHYTKSRHAFCFLGSHGGHCAAEACCGRCSSSGRCITPLSGCCGSCSQLLPHS